MRLRNGLIAALGAAASLGHAVGLTLSPSVQSQAPGGQGILELRLLGGTDVVYVGTTIAIDKPRLSFVNEASPFSLSAEAQSLGLEVFFASVLDAPGGTPATGGGYLSLAIASGFGSPALQNQGGNLLLGRFGLSNSLPFGGSAAVSLASIASDDAHSLVLDETGSNILDEVSGSSVHAVPEPASLAAVAIGIVSLAWRRRRR